MGIYIFILITTLFLGTILKPNQDNKKKKIFIILVFGILTTVSAIRNIKVGVDTEQFCNAFKRISDMSLSYAFKNLRYEKGFIILCHFLSYITNDRQGLIVISSLIIFPTMGYFIYKNSKDVVLSSVMYITLNTYAMHMNVMRQAIAISIIILGYELFFKKGKLIRYVLIVLLASFFHQTALVMVVLIIIRNKRFTIKTYIICNIVAVGGFLFAARIWNIAVSLFPTYVGYSDTDFFATSYLAGMISAVIAWGILTMGIFFERKSKAKSELYNFCAYTMSIIFIVDVLVIRINLFVRLATYFGIFTLIWLPSTLQSIEDKKEKILMKYIVLVCFILYWLILAIYRPEWYGVIPYNTFLV